jgi:hypothetical protein
MSLAAIAAPALSADPFITGLGTATRLPPLGTVRSSKRSTARGHLAGVGRTAELGTRKLSIPIRISKLLSQNGKMRGS